MERVKEEKLGIRPKRSMFFTNPEPKDSSAYGTQNSAHRCDKPRALRKKKWLLQDPFDNNARKT